ncbi:MAG: CAP domain-containing protein [bacterium]
MCARRVTGAHRVIRSRHDAVELSTQRGNRRSHERREKNLGLSTLVRNTTLMKAAQLHANQMAALNTMAHELPGAAYPSPRSRLDAVGYRMRAFGENVAEGYPSAAAVVAGWMTSPGHRANIVSTHFTEIGAGVATAKNGRPFYAQVFASPR